MKYRVNDIFKHKNYNVWMELIKYNGDDDWTFKIIKSDYNSAMHNWKVGRVVQSFQVTGNCLGEWWDNIK